MAAALVAPPEERTRPRVAELVQELVDDPLGDAVAALACLPIERYEVDARLFEPTFAGDAASGHNTPAKRAEQPRHTDDPRQDDIQQAILVTLLVTLLASR